MAFLTEETVEARARKATTGWRRAADILTESVPGRSETFDVFLSHSSNEPENILLGVRLLLEERGLSVYVDRYSDPGLSPEGVTKQTAEVLRRRMRHSRTLLYIHSRHSGDSRWMPWELGFFDGLKGAVGVLPVKRSRSESFEGQEYLGLYPYIDISSPLGKWWINSPSGGFVDFSTWISDPRKLGNRSG